MSENFKDFFKVFKNFMTMLSVRGYNIELDNFFYKRNGVETNYLNNIDTLTYDKFKECIRTKPKKNTITKEVHNILPNYDDDLHRHMFSNVVFDEEKNKVAIFFFAYTPQNKLSTSKDELTIFAGYHKRVRLYLESVDNKLSNNFIPDSNTIYDLIFISTKNLHAPKPSDINTYELWLDEDLSYNPTLSEYNSEFRLLTKEESDYIFKNSTISNTEISKIHKNHIVPKYYGAKEKQIFEIISYTLIPNSMFKREINYRIVDVANIESKANKSKKNEIEVS